MKALKFFFLFFLVPAFLVQTVAQVKKQNGKTIRIVDGDTFDLLTKDKKVIRIRMAGIDAPERKQDYYQSAKNTLSGFIFSRDVEFVRTGYDRNKRTIAMVFCDGKNINLAMIKSGQAWHYTRYSADTSFANAERQARLEKRGLWRKPAPVAPWSFRSRR